MRKNNKDKSNERQLSEHSKEEQQRKVIMQMRKIDNHSSSDDYSHDGDNQEDSQVASFPTECPSCHEMIETVICVKNIPHFKQVILMSLNCDKCDYKSNEVKGGNGHVPIDNLGTKIELSVNSIHDLARDVIKSDTAGIEIPELGLKLEDGGLGGFYSTIEGLLLKIYNQLRSVNALDIDVIGVGNYEGNNLTEKISSDGQSDLKFNSAYMEMLGKINAMANGEILPFTIIITDPLSNSFVNSIPEFQKHEERCSHNSGDDKSLVITKFQRSDEQNENLGLMNLNT